MTRKETMITAILPEFNGKMLLLNQNKSTSAKRINVECQIFIDPEGSVFLLSNVMNGARSEHKTNFKYNFKFSYAVNYGTKRDLENEAISEVRLIEYLADKLSPDQVSEIDKLIDTLW